MGIPHGLVVSAARPRAYAEFVDTVVRAATEENIPQIAAMMARAFDADPVMRWAVPRAESRPRRLAGVYRAIVQHEGVPFGATDAAVSEGAVVGAAVWRPPGRRLIGRHAVPFALAAGWALGPSIPRMVTMGRRVFAAYPAQPHWYLQLLAVDPVVQRRGVGTALMVAGLDRVDAERMLAYLETTSGNLAFYERLGFRVSGEVRMPRSSPRQFRLLRSTP